MFAGLLFANDDADDRPETLAATLRFGGSTLIEFQARQLIAAGAMQIVIAVTRTTPELIGAVNRIERRGVSIDLVRSAAEALEKVHPLATVLILADGLITSDAVIAAMATGEGDALLVIADDDAPPGLERIDGRSFWGGIARIGPRRLADAARLPDEYDLQSTLLRVIAQGGAARTKLPVEAVRQGHGIERDSRRLAERGRLALGTRLSARTSWFDRYLLAPLARWTLPPLIDRGIPAAGLSIASAVLALAGLILLWRDLTATGLIVALLAAVLLALVQALCWLRGEERQAKYNGDAAIAVAASAAAVLGWTISRDAGTATGWLAAAVLLVTATLVERAAGVQPRRRWWGTPPAYLLLLVIGAAAHVRLAGLIVAAGYAAAALADAVERFRRKP